MPRVASLICGHHNIHAAPIVWLLCWVQLIYFLKAVSAQLEIGPDDLYEGIQRGRFDAVIDVRTEDEWNSGHIETTTFVEDLASSGNVSLLTGCEDGCEIVVYCLSGNRAGVAIDRLRDEFGFTGVLWNGLGVSQWTSAGYPLVETLSVIPTCTMDAMACTRIENVTTTSPTSPPTTAVVDLEDGDANMTTTMGPSQSPINVVTPPPTITLTSAELYSGLKEGKFKILVDVRSDDEWEGGHIENATLVANLASEGIDPDILFGCEDDACAIVVYCNSGARAAVAITRLRNEYGFQGQLYNGLGVTQWVDAGFGLVMTESFVPPCSKKNRSISKSCQKCCASPGTESDGASDSDQNIKSDMEVEASSTGPASSSLVSLASIGRLIGLAYTMNLFL